MPRYPSPENVGIQPQARTFILFALTLAYPMFGAGFELWFIDNSMNAAGAGFIFSLFRSG